MFRWHVDPETDLCLPAPGQRTDRLNTSSLGLRGDKVASPKPKGVLRLAFVGASTTFCAQVGPDSATWPAQVAAGLA